MNKIESFLYELNNSSDRIYNIFTTGSCFRLYLMLKIFYEEAEPYWSDIDNHCITKINNDYYDIGGKLSKSYIKSKGYFKIDNSLLKGYRLLKKTEEDVNLSVIIEKYK